MRRAVDFDPLALCRFTRKQETASALADQYGYFLFGGARGPGKSYWLRWHAIYWLIRQYAEFGLRGVNAMLACESYPTLYDRQEKKCLEEFPEELGTWALAKREFTLRPEYGGGVLCLRHLGKGSGSEDTKYKSAEFGLVAIDELTQISFRVFTQLRGSMRWPGLPKAQFIAATNPTGPHANWVRDLWIERNFPDEFRAFHLEKQFAFLPGLPRDNPFLTPDYWMQLNTLPEILKKAWVFGDWYAGIEGAVYPNFGPENISEDADYDPAKGDVFWFIDDGMAIEHPRAILLCQMPALNTFHIFAEYYVSMEGAEESIDNVLEAMPYPKPKMAIFDPSSLELQKRLWAKHIGTRRPRHLVEEGVKRMLHVICDGDGIRRLIVHPRCENFIGEMRSYIRDDRGRIIKANDHGPDGCRYGIWDRYRVGREDQIRRDEARKAKEQKRLRDEMSRARVVRSEMPDLPTPPPPRKRG